MNIETPVRADVDTEHTPLHERVNEAMARFQVPGVAVGIHYRGRDHVAGFGVTNANHPLPVDADTLFQIGSTTKTVTATVVMRLVEQGSLDLDVPVRSYLPDLRLADEDVAARVTLRHLFTHTGGWQGDYFDDTGEGDDALARIVERMVNLRQLTPLGALFSYNNAGFYLAGRGIEMLTGQPYEAAARDLVLGPLGMTRSFFFTREVITDRVAVGHRVGKHGPEVQRDWALPRAAHAVGGLISTVVDQLRYARFHMGDGTAADGTQLLSPQSLALMQSPQTPAGNGIDALGLSWMLRDVGGIRIVQHGGTTNGQLSAFLFVPACGFALTILTNADRGAPLHREITTWALEHYLGAKDPDPMPQDVPVDLLTPYAGHYTAMLSDLDLAVSEGALVAQSIPKGGFPTKDSPPPPAPPPMHLALVAEDRVVVLDGPAKHTRAEFLRHPDGRIMGLRIGFRVLIRQE